MKSKRGSTNYSIEINGQRYLSSSIIRFLRKTRTIKWENKVSVYLRVFYGIQKNSSGKNVMYYNDGNYTNKKEFSQALTAFLEE